ncbi:MAG: hypothetical protein AABY22_34315, partial [Nanoarchaeota archaeon]
MKRIKGLKYQLKPITKKVIGDYQIKVCLTTPATIKTHFMWERLIGTPREDDEGKEDISVPFKTKEDAIKKWVSIGNEAKLKRFFEDNRGKKWMLMEAHFQDKNGESDYMFYSTFAKNFKQAKDIVKKKVAKDITIKSYLKGLEFTKIIKSKVVGGAFSM